MPVYIEIPRDMVAVEVAPVPVLDPPAADPEAVTACAAEVMARLAAAKRPVLLVDVEVRRFGLEARVAELARRLDVPAVTTFMGRGLLTTTDAPLAGTYLGPAGDPAVAELVEGSDGLLLLGVILSDTNFGVSAGRLDLRRTIQALDRQVSIGFHTYPNLPLPRTGRSAPGAGTAFGRQPPAGPAARLPARAHRLTRRRSPRRTSPGPSTTCSIAKARCRSRATSATACSPPWRSRTTSSPPPATTPAWAMACRPGSGPSSPPVGGRMILVGDGAFQMTGMELGNCARLGIDPVVVLFNNASWEMLRAFQPESRFNDLGEWRFADLADALGGKGYRAHTRAELAQALDQAAASRGRFQLVEAMIPRGVLSPTLARFVEGQKRLTRPIPA